MSGFGSSSAGTFVFGFGSPGTATAITGKAHDDGTGTQTGSRKIDEGTRQYAFDSNGRVLGMSDARQLVLMRIATVRQSSVVGTLGQGLSSIQEMGDDFEQRVDIVLRSALADIVANGTIAVVAVTVQRIPSAAVNQSKGALINLKWRDLTDPKRREHTERVQ